MSWYTLTGFGDEIAPELETQLEVMAKLGISHLEIRGVNGINVSDLTIPQAKEAKSLLDSRGFAVSAVGSPIGKVRIDQPFEPHMEKFLHTLELARLFETRYIRMFSFYIPPGETPAKWRGEVLERLQRMLEAASGSGIVLLHENEADIYGESAECCLDLMEALGSPGFRMTFDPCNFILNGVEPCPEAYEMLADHIEYLHIKDGIAESKKIVPAGMGECRIEELLRALKSRGFRGFISLEPHLGSFAGLAQMEHRLDLSSLPEGGAQTFAAAFEALDGILRKI